MAPELLLGKTKPNPATDVYSFGIVMSEVFSRKCPYSNFDGWKMETLIAHISDPKISLRPSVPDTCAQNVVVLMKECVASNQLQRPTFEEIGK